MKRVKVDIQHSNKGTFAVEAWTTDSPYLFVHRSLGRVNGDGKPDTLKKAWTVTHGPTGFSCGSPFSLRVQALAYARRMGELVNLDFTDPKDTPSVGDEHREARTFAFSQKGRHIVEG